MAVKKGRDVDAVANATLQAIVLADGSFDQHQNKKFAPITHETPKVLLPLVNVPVVEYTLSWLQSVGVTEVFVFCCDQVKDYLHMSDWLAEPNFKVSIIVSKNCVCVGDALRLMYERDVIHGDFILVNGDTVSNMMFDQAIVEHKERRRKYSKAVMTMVVKKSMPCQITKLSRFGNDEMIIAVDSDTKQLLSYEDTVEDLSVVSLDKAMVSDNRRAVSLYNDRQDCWIDICSPEVLSIFNENFDYQDMRNDFVKGLLFDDAQGFKIFTYDICSGYAARVDNIRSYDAISKDIIRKWTYPSVPDVLFENSETNLGRERMFRASEVVGQSQIGPLTVIGSGTIIGNKTTISKSVVGGGCTIGSNVTIDGCYIWNNVTIEDGCELKHAIVCDGVILKAGAVLEPGVVLSFKVVIGEKFVVPSYSKVSLLRQPIMQDSDDEELNYTDGSSGIAVNTPTADGANMGSLPEMDACATSEVGSNGVGFIWLPTEAEEWRYSVAPIPADKLVAIMLAADNDPELPTLDDNILPPFNDSDSEVADDDSDSEVADDDEIADFEKEVEATFLRAVEEDVEEGNVILEINSLRLAYNMTPLACAGALFYSLMTLAFDMEHNSTSELYKNVTSVMVKWHKLLRTYLKSTDEEIEIILKFEEICMDSVKEYTSLFTLILVFMYDNNIIQKEAVLMWESEKEKADESDRFFVKKAENFLRGLKEGSEE
ncbi:eIF-2B GDP-GTP exchange factor subunit epsilon [Heracleum sosnowskyi]|uniref:Translation initiation factor eIF2B subunit epsilon n=1 Tax=Heracleum sosnowskyi TaxID=360622 RepID=A0AAD8I004_9APIA|nr:eIF-2B GDP-GTP exchange factor subunit epsilon [Heracleum sosnowskyi]